MLLPYTAHLARAARRHVLSLLTDSPRRPVPRMHDSTGSPENGLDPGTRVVRSSGAPAACPHHCLPRYADAPRTGAPAPALPSGPSRDPRRWWSGSLTASHARRAAPGAARHPSPAWRRDQPRRNTAFVFVTQRSFPPLPLPHSRLARREPGDPSGRNRDSPPPGWARTPAPAAGPASRTRGHGAGAPLERNRSTTHRAAQVDTARRP